MSLLAPAAQYAPAGLRALLVGPWTPGASYVYADSDLDIITDLDPAAVWWPVDCDQATSACEFGQAYTLDKNGEAYQQTIAVALPGLLVALRSGLLGLARRPLLALCQDMREQWWLFGQDGTLRLPTWVAKGGPAGGETLTSAQLTGRQSAPARQVVLPSPVPVVATPFPPAPGGGSPTRTTNLPFILAGPTTNPTYSKLK
jgi:hypothetical protein